MFYMKELKAFNTHKIQYIVVGGMAFNLLGGFRSTIDLDILIDLTESNLAALVALLKKHNYKLQQPSILRQYWTNESGHRCDL